MFYLYTINQISYVQDQQSCTLVLPLHSFNFSKAYAKVICFLSFFFIKEGLHVTFYKAMENGLFSCLSIGFTIPLVVSHIYYADDALFIVEWKNSKISNLICILHCFHLASGIKINLNKSKLVGISVSRVLVE